MKFNKTLDHSPAAVKALRPDMPDMEKEAARIRAKRCPFCGGSAQLDIRYVYGITPTINISCRSCGARTTSKIVGITGEGKNHTCIERLIESAEIWNKRHKAPGTQQAVNFGKSTIPYSESPAIINLLGADLQALEKEAAGTTVKRCPICDGEAVLTIGILRNAPVISICCKSCGTNAGRITGDRCTAIDLFHQATEIWNRRT